MLNSAREAVPEAVPEAAETPQANTLRVLELAARGWLFIDARRA